MRRTDLENLGPMARLRRVGEHPKLGGRRSAPGATTGQRALPVLSISGYLFGICSQTVGG